MTKMNWDRAKSGGYHLEGPLTHGFANAGQRKTRVLKRKTTWARYDSPKPCPACGHNWARGARIGRSYHELGWVHGYCMGVALVPKIDGGD